MTEQPLSAEQAQTMQKAWADHLGLDVAFENSVGMQLRVITPGTFRMGRPKAQEAHKRPVEVTLGQAFLIGQFEVTQGEWERVMGPIETKLDVGAGNRFPMYNVNHTEAAEFCRKLTQLDREAGKLPDGYGYRLPTDAEWEYACRAGTVTATHFGDKLSSTQANFDGSRPHGGAAKGPTLGKVVEVGSYPANAWGLHDMHANMGEWCLDYYHKSVKAGVDQVQLKPAPEPAPHRTNRLIRGGSFKGPAGYAVSANRYFEQPEARRSHLGFRPVLSKLHLTNSGKVHPGSPSPVVSGKTPAAGKIHAPAASAVRLTEPKPVVMTEQPLTTEQAKAVQKAWAKQLGFDVKFENSIGMQLRVIPPGTYRMSSPHRKGPVEVSLSQAFLIGQFEVTQGEWARVMGPIEQELDVGAGDRFPIYRVNHTEASEFCRKLTKLERQAGKLPDGYQYRLPTEVEWEFACRAGTLTRTHFGENMSSKLANYDGNFPLPGSEKGPSLGRTAKVGTYPANAWGLHEIHGNLNEWCLDWYHHEVKGGVDPVHLLPPKRDEPAMVIRDCSWRGNGRYCHTAHRTHRPPDWSENRNGFRAVLTKVHHGKVAAITHADDSAAPKAVAMPKPVVMTEQPLTTEQARAAQKAWADHLGVDAIAENSIGMELSVIPPGTFPMGWEDRTGEDGPQEVTHSQPYFIGRHEVTQGEWERVMGPLGRHRKEVGDSLPVNGINHAEAAEFCRKLTVLDRKAGKLLEGYEYRLPTDAELEYACRAGTLTLTYFGNTLSSTQANFDGREPLNKGEKGPFLNRLAEVGSYPGNAWGLHDTYGSLYEWCFDWYHARLNGGVDPVHLLPAPDRPVAKRVKRGGAWKYAGRYCRSANRYYDALENRSSVVGFRPVLSKLHLDAFHQLTDGTQPDFAIWTRDGTNTRIWHKKDLKTRNYLVMSGPVHSLPGKSYAVSISDKNYDTWAHACLTDGRILVRSNPPNQEPGYFLMTPNKGGTPKFERIHCDLATKGVLDRIRISPSETKVCFEFQTGFESGVSSRTLYVAGFDAKQPAITDAKPFANEDGKPVWYAWPRWSKDESAIVYQADGKLYQYNLASKSTTLAGGSPKTSVSPHLVTRSVSEGSKGKTVPPNPSLPRRVTNGSETRSNKTTKVATKKTDDSATPERVVMTEHALTAEQAKTAQQAWADHLGVDAVVENSIGMELSVIPPGTFPMGRENKKSEVTHSQPFLIGRYEVTQGEWQRVMGSVLSVEELGAGDRFPVYQVNHAEAAEFCQKLTGLDRKVGILPKGYEYRLPTDAEWEYACRAGTLTATHFGDKLSSTLANFDGSHPYRGAAKGPILGKMAEVGSYPANAWGLHDMHGNSGEWCLDYYHKSAKAGVDPVQLQPAPEPHQTHRLIRGGRFNGPAGYCISANRYFERQEARRMGFRPVLSKLHLDSGDKAQKVSQQDSAEPNRVVITENPLTTEQAQAAQKSWAEHIEFDVAFENSIGMKLRVIPPGTFHMVSPKAEEGHQGPVDVTLSQAFLIGQFEVTQGEWKRVMGPIERKLDAGAGDRFPVYRVDHTEATEFCRKLTQLDRKAGKLPIGYQYRLPTDAEWGFACRAGTLTLTHFGDKKSSHLANYDGSRPFRDSEKGPNLNRTAEVGSYPANAWGLHNMHGNVSEWCMDWYHHKVKGGVDPVQLQPTDWERPPMVVRPSSWGSPGKYGHSAGRYHSPSWTRNPHIGFRPVLSKLHLDQ